METLEMELPVKKTDLVLAGEKINTGLVSFEERKATLNALKEEATGLKIESVDDKVGFLKVSTTRKKLKAARVEIEKEAKSLRDHISGISKNISAKEKELIEIIEPSEDELQKEEDRIAAEKQKIQDEKEAAEKARIQARIDKLAAYGFTVEYNTILVIDDATFEGVLNNAKLEHEKELAAKAETERLAKLEAEKLAAERKELEELRGQQVEAQRVIDENNARIKKEQDEKEAAIKAEQDKIAAEKRAQQLAAEKLEADRLQQIALNKAKEEAAEAARLKAIADAKQAAENEARELAAAKAEEARQAALQPDKVKLQLFSDNLSTLQLPVVANENAQLIVNEIQLMINKMQAHILKKIKDL